MTITKTQAQIMADSQTIAVVGFSSKEQRPGNYVPAYLAQQGYTIIPVNPNLTEGLGQPAYPDLHAIPVPVDLVLLFQRSENVPPFVDDAIDIGAKAIWMQLGIVNEPAADKARASGLAVVMDSCMMVDHRQWRGQ